MSGDELRRALGEFAQKGVYFALDASGGLSGNTATDVEFGARFDRLPSGLLVPTGVIRNSPLDYVATFLTVGEIFGSEPDQEFVRRNLERCSILEPFYFAAGIMARYRIPGLSRDELDRQLTKEWFKEPFRTRVLNLLSGGNRALVASQAVLFLLKQALLYCPDEGSTEGPRALPLTLLAVAARLDSGVEEIPDEELTIDQNPGPLGNFLVANQHFNSEIDVSHLFARTHHTWFDGTAASELRQDFRQATGQDFDQFCLAALALHSRCVRGEPLVPLSYFDDIPGWNADKAQEVLSLMIADLQTLRRMTAEEVSDQKLVWDRSTFERFPVVRVDDERLLVVDPGLLIRRVFGWLPFWDVVNGYQDQGATDSSNDFKRRIRLAAEDYIDEILVNICGGATGRLYLDADLQKAYRRRKARIADAVIDYGDGWVVFEITTSQLKRESIFGDKDAIDSDLDKLIGEVEQIDSTITLLRTSSQDLTEIVASDTPHRFYPVLVMTEGFTVNPITTSVLRERARARGLLVGDDVAQLEIIDTVELEMMENLVDRGSSLCALFDGKGAASLAKSSMRQYLIGESGRAPVRSKRVSDRFHAFFELLSEPLRPETSG